MKCFFFLKNSNTLNPFVSVDRLCCMLGVILVKLCSSTHKLSLYGMWQCCDTVWMHVVHYIQIYPSD